MKYNSLFKIVAFVSAAVFAISCDKDFNEIGADFVDNDHYSFETATYPVRAHNQGFGAVQSNNLPINALGYYNNPVFGKTKATFVTQLELATPDPTFYRAPSDIIVDSVYLHVPYFSKLVSTEANGDSTYELDSIYGSGKIKLEVFRSNYYLRNLGPNPITGEMETQSYFSNEYNIGTNTIGTRLNNESGTKSWQNDDFEFRNSEIKFYKADGTTVRERLLPGIYMDLDPAYFKSQIIQAGANLADNNTFKNYFRGLSFRVTPHADNLDGAALAMLNFAQGKIVIRYRDNSSSSNTTEVRKTMALNMKGYTVNLLENTNNATNGAYTSALASANMATGDPRLYLKGGHGSMAIIDLFGGATNDGSVDLNTMRNENWLVNEANLVFNIDNSAGAMGANDVSLEPNRIYLYDFNNKKPLIDYYFDTSTFANPKFNKYVHSGIVQKVSNGARGTKYKIRITNHIRSLIANGGPNVTKDSTNVRLGLVVTESINSVTSYKALNPFPYLGNDAKFVPAMSVANPLGVVLYGGTTDVPADLRLKLEIVYTKPD